MDGFDDLTGFRPEETWFRRNTTTIKSFLTK